MTRIQIQPTQTPARHGKRRLWESLHRYGWRRIAVRMTLSALALTVPGHATASELDEVLQESLRAYFERTGSIDGLELTALTGTRLNNASLAGLYSQRQYQPLWLGQGPLAQQILQLTQEIAASANHGLTVSAYHLEAIEQLLARTKVAERLQLELLLSDAVLRQVQHRSSGVVSPRSLDPEWAIIPVETSAVAWLLDQAKQSTSLAAELKNLWPQSDEYRALLKRRSSIEAASQTYSSPIPSGPLLKPGMHDSRVESLKQRLFGPGNYDHKFDEETLQALLAFQRASGLEADGILGPGTLSILNARAVDWVDRIDANLERWRWLPRETPDSMIRVNIAGFRLRVIENWRDVLSMDIISGRPTRRTPVFTEDLQYLVFSPFWNLPHKIAVEDKLPQLQKDPATLAAQGYEARAGTAGEFRSVDQFDWSQVKRRPFGWQLRQRPGPQNALGGVKFMLPNAYAIYLHDTPNQELFAKTERSFSSGCIRLSRPAALADWILARERHELAGTADSLMKLPQPRTIYLKHPLPVWIVYFTAFTNDEDEVEFRRDIYNRDDAIVNMLRRP